MARKKVKLAYIINSSARKTTLKKRRKGVMKKLSELSTLCGVDACAIIYSPDEPQLDVWPSPSGVENVLEKFENAPDLQKTRKMLNQESFVRERLLKAKEQLKKVTGENSEKELECIIIESLTAGVPKLQNLKMTDINYLTQLINQKLDVVNGKQMN